MESEEPMMNNMSERRIRNNRIRRRRALRKHVLTFFMTLLLIAACSTIFFSAKTRAQGNDEQILYKYYKSITVAAGDTLWNFADQYAEPSHYPDHQSYIDEVVRMNGLTDEHITSGQHIVLPYYSNEFM